MVELVETKFDVVVRSKLRDSPGVTEKGTLSKAVGDLENEGRLVFNVAIELF